MSNKDNLKERVDNTSGGDEIGGTSFGQTPGEANHDAPRQPDDKKNDDKSDRRNGADD